MDAPFRLPAAPAMPPPSELAICWIIDRIAGNDSVDFNALCVLVEAYPEVLQGAPEATRERVARRCLQQVYSVIAERGDAAAGVPRVGGARSCQELLFQITTEAVGSSGKVEKDLLAPFIEDIQAAICAETLPQTPLFKLLGEIAAASLEDTAGLGT